MNLKNFIFVALSNFAILSPLSATDCGCGEGETITIKFSGSAENPWPTGTVNLSATLGEASTSSPSPASVVVTPVAEVKMTPGTTLAGTMTLAIAGTPADSKSAGGRVTFTPEEACGWDLRIQYFINTSPGGRWTDWKDTKTLESGASYVTTLETQFRIQLVKKTSEPGDGTENPTDQESPGTVTPAELPPAAQSSPPNSSGNPASVVPQRVRLKVPLGSNTGAGGYNVGDVVLEGIIGQSLVNLQNLKFNDPMLPGVMVVKKKPLEDSGSEVVRQIHINTPIVNDGSYDQELIDHKNVIASASAVGKLIDIIENDGSIIIRHYEAGSFPADTEMVTDPSAPRYGIPHVRLIPFDSVPSKTVTYSKVAPSGDHIGGLRVTIAAPNTVTRATEYLNLPGENNYRIATVDGTTTLESKDSTTGFTRTAGGTIWSRVHTEVTKRGGVPYSEVEYTSVFLWNETSHARFTIQEKVTTNATGGTLITTWVPDPVHLGKPQSVVRPDGSWEAYTYYSGTETGANLTWKGQLKQTLRPWNGLPTSPSGATINNSEAETVVKYDYGDGLQPVIITTSKPSSSGPKIVSKWSGAYGGYSSGTMATALTNAGLSPNWHIGGSTRSSTSTRTVGSETVTSRSYSYIDTRDYLGGWSGASAGETDDRGNGSATGYERGTYQETGSGYTFTVNALSGAFVPTEIQEGWGSDIRSVTINFLNNESPVNGEGTRTVIITNSLGQPYVKELSIRDGSGAWQVASTTNYQYTARWADGSARAVIVRKDGRIVLHRILEAVGTLLRETVTDEQGIETRTDIDAIGRPVSSVRKGVSPYPDIVTTYTYSGRTTTVTTTAGGITRQTSTTEDLAGRLISETDATGAITSTSYDSNGLVVTTEYPGGRTRIVTRSIDGLTRSITGTAVIDESYSYNVVVGPDPVPPSTAAPSVATTTTRRIGDLVDSPRYTITETDGAGRVVRETSPSPTGTGESITSYIYQAGTTRLISRNSAAGDVLYGWDLANDAVALPSRSSLTWIGYNLDGAAGLQLASTDRVTETRTYYALESGYCWEISYQKSLDVASNGSSGISTISKRCLHGSPGGAAAKEIQILPSGETITTTTTFDRTAKTAVTTRVTSASSVIATTVDTNGFVTSSSDHNSTNPTVLTYNAIGQVTKEVSPRGAVSYTFYNMDGSVKSTVDPYGKKTTYEYFAHDTAYAGQLQKVTDPAGKTKEYTYSLLGQVMTEGGTSTYPIQFTYDEYGAMKTLKTTRNGTTQDTTTWTYLPGTGLLQKKTDAAGQFTAYEYTAAGRVSKRTWARNVSSTYSYSAEGDFTGITYSDSTPAVALSDRDRLGRPLTVSLNGVVSEKLAYHQGTGTLKARYNASTHPQLSGRGIRYGLPDSGGRATGFSETSGSDVTVVRPVSYGYDASGRLEIITDGTQNHLYGYHPDSSLVSTIQSRTGSTAWFRESRHFDAPGRLIGIRSDKLGSGADIKLTSHAYDYDALGRRTKNTFQDGSTWNYGYNDRSEVTSATRKTPAGTTIPQLGASYSYDNIGNRLGSTSPLLGDHTYTSGSTNQYTAVTTGDKRTAAGRAPAGWTVQVAGTNATRTGEIYHRELTASNATAPVWQSVLTKSTDPDPDFEQTNRFWFAKASVTPTYDVDGNLTDDGRWVYTWDAENRLVQMTTTAAAITALHPYTTIKFVYDWQGRRVARTVWQGGTSDAATFKSNRRWLYDGWNVIAEFSATSEIATTATRLNTFTWGLDLSGNLRDAGGVGGLLSQNTVAGGAIHRASYDGNGNIVVWTKSDQTVPVHRREYDAFGNTLISEGTSPSTFGFSTKMQDTETGLYYYGYRYYEPSNGRWLNRDRIEEKGGVNLYGFVLNNPIKWVDVLGNALWPGQEEEPVIGPPPNDTGLPDGFFDTLPGGYPTKQLAGMAGARAAAGLSRDFDRKYNTRPRNGIQWKKEFAGLICKKCDKSTNSIDTYQYTKPHPGLTNGPWPKKGPKQRQYDYTPQGGAIGESSASSNANIDYSKDVNGRIVTCETALGKGWVEVGYYHSHPYNSGSNPSPNDFSNPKPGGRFLGWDNDEGELIATEY